MQLKDLGIIVTGGSNGIGAATVRTYARESARVAALDVDDAAGEANARAAGDGVKHFSCNVSNRADVERAFAAAVTWLGKLDVLAHVAAVERGGPAEAISEADWRELLAINVLGTVFTNQVAFGYMRDRGGRIINFGSGGAVRGQPGSSHYAASKGAVAAFTRTVAQEWARYKITVNAVAPGAWTRMFDEYLARLPEQARQQHLEAMRRIVPLGGKLGDPEKDIAPVMVFLASDAAHFMTGQLVSVDGGMVMLGA